MQRVPAARTRRRPRRARAPGEDAAAGAAHHQLVGDAAAGAARHHLPVGDAAAGAARRLPVGDAGVVLRSAGVAAPAGEALPPCQVADCPRHEMQRARGWSILTPS